MWFFKPSTLYLHFVLILSKYVTEDEVNKFQQLLISKFVIDKSLRYYMMKKDIRKEEQMASQLSKLIQKILSRPNLQSKELEQAL